MVRWPALLASMSASTPSMATEPELAQPARRRALRAAAGAAIVHTLFPLSSLGASQAAEHPVTAGAAHDVPPPGSGAHPGRPTGADPSSARYLAARKRGAGFEAAVIDATGHDLHTIALADRGHSFALDPASCRAVAFGRQPGCFATAFHLDGSAEPISL